MQRGNKKSKTPSHARNTCQSQSQNLNESECSLGHSSNSQMKTLNDPAEDSEFLQFQREWIRSAYCHLLAYVNVREVTIDLFEVDEGYSLVHSVSEDMSMDNGIALTFRRKFKRVGQLLNQHQRTGGLAILQDKNRFIYYLVTKKYSFGKLTMSTLFSSLKCLRDHVVKNRIDKIAMPRIGCGSGGLEWPEVKIMIDFLFLKVNIDIVICNLEPTITTLPQEHRNCNVTNEIYPIQDITSDTIILYFSSEDGVVSDEMEALDEKFHFLREFQVARKMQGEVIFYGRQTGYLLCGCIVRKSKSDRFDFVALQRCLNQIQKENKKYNYYHCAFQAMQDRNDHLPDHKIINMLKNGLRNIEVNVCWPGERAPRDERDSFNKTEESRGDSKDTRETSTNISEVGPMEKNHNAGDSIGITASDEFQIFGDYVASEMRSLKSEENRRRLKRIIQKTILDVSSLEDNESDDSYIEAISHSISSAIQSQINNQVVSRAPRSGHEAST